MGHGKERHGRVELCHRITFDAPIIRLLLACATAVQQLASVVAVPHVKPASVFRIF